MYSWFRQGYATGTLDQEAIDIAKRIADGSNFDEGEVVLDQDYPHDEETYSNVYTDGKFSTYYSPVDVHVLSHHIVRHPTFQEIHKKMASPVYNESFWLNEIKLVEYSLWKSKGPKEWHADYGPFDIQVLIYLTEEDLVGGELKVGVMDEAGDIEEVYRHAPVDGTFVMVQSNNPYLPHCVNPLDGERYVMELRYKINS